MNSKSGFSVEVWLDKTSQPLEHAAVNTYEKGAFYCVYDGSHVTKYPLAHIFRVVEDYRAEDDDD